MIIHDHFVNDDGDYSPFPAAGPGRCVDENGNERKVSLPKLNTTL